MGKHFLNTERIKNPDNLEFYTQEKYLSKKWRWNKDFSDLKKKKKVERIHHQQSYTTRNLKESSSGRRKTISNVNPIYTQSKKRTSNGNYMDK